MNGKFIEQQLYLKGYLLATESLVDQVLMLDFFNL